jgi:hypothetical protein
MSLFGLDIYNGNQQLVFTTTDTAWSLVGFFAARPEVLFTAEYPAAAGMELRTLQQLIDVLPNDQEAYTHTITVSGNMVTSSGNGTQTTLIMVFGR